jgi:hypothetical protein
MEAVRTSETSVNFYETARRIIPEGSHLHHILFFICCYSMTLSVAQAYGK